MSQTAENATIVAFPSKRNPRRTRITRELVKSLQAEPKQYDCRDTELTGFIVRVNPSGVMSYVVEIARAKRVTIGRTTEVKPNIARDIATKILGNVATGRDPWEGIKATANIDGPEVPTLGEFVAGSNPDEKDVRKWDGDYATWYAANRRSERGYSENMRRLKSVFAQQWAMPLTEITPGVLETLKTDRKRKDKNSNATIRRDLSRLRGVFRLARKRGFANDAFEHVDLPDVDSAPKVRFLEDDERRRLRQALGLAETPDYLRAMVVVSLNTGLRRGELFSLAWESVDFKRNVLTVEATTSKTHRTRHVALNATAKAALKDWKPKDATGLVFPSSAGKFWTVKKSWASLLRRAEITRFRWHDMRHDFASRLVMGGIELFTVGALLGHDRATTTQRYAHLAASHKTAAVEVLDAD